MLDANVKNETRYCVPLWVRDEQIRVNVRKVKDRIEAGEDKSEPIAIVGYAPSLNDTWKELKNFKTIITCSGSHTFLLGKGIIPTFHAEVDPREHKVELLGKPHKSVQYYPASCVHPKYIQTLLDAGAPVALWHVYAQDGESEQVIPKGEWMVTGGCDVGMRAMTIARFLGYKDFHIFGLDGCEGKTGKHAGSHPNQPKGNDKTIYNGKEFITTPALLECAKQVFHELDQLTDVKFKFYGDGLIQEMAKNYVRKEVGQSAIAALKPELISEEMRKLNSDLHNSNLYYGVGGGKYAETVLKMKTEGINSILDYGCGKGYLAKSLPFPIWQYDPAIAEFSESPRPADLVISTDVLEHIEPDKLDAVLADLKRVVLQIGYFVIHLGAAKKTYADGRNTHLIQQSADWWVKKLSKYFDVATAQVKGNELHTVVGVKTFQSDPNAVIGVKGKDGIKSRFYIPNEACKWRAETLVTKEPVTIDWIEKMPKGSILYDIGANVGGYSVWAGMRGIQTLSFEPEAENYALLVKNLGLNNLKSQAFCLAVSDSLKLDTLHLSQSGAGGSCHSFAESVDAFGAHRNGNHPEQSCFGISIDELIEKGLPSPEYIKIDVDGFEPKVIKGASKALRTVKSLLIEVNPKLDAHLEMIDILTTVYGFTFDKEQVKRSTRQAGNFKGVAEYVFFRQTETEKHLLKAIESAELRLSPFPYFYIENVLPDGEYKRLLKVQSEYAPIKKVRNLRGYPQRFVGDLERPEWMDVLKNALLGKFGLSDNNYSDEHLLIKDLAGYKIGAHTDAPQRVLSAILYLAKDGDDESLGTCIYEPKDKSFKSSDGKHYSDLSKFKKVALMPYRPNSMFVFLKTDNSFHGVEETKAERRVLLYDIRR